MCQGDDGMPQLFRRFLRRQQATDFRQGDPARIEGCELRYERAAERGGGAAIPKLRVSEKG